MKLDVSSTVVWRRARSVFDQVVDLETPARDEALRSACGDDPEVLEAVQALLQHDRADPSSGTESARSAEGPTARRPADSATGPGTRLGSSYHLQSVLGRGGTGTVYLATRQHEGFEQDVAVKILHQDLDDFSFDRFRRERRILAQLEHPGIARLIDGGSTEDGRPFVVMEYVDGLPITSYCERRGLDVDARIDLFRQVCDAVEYAHRYLVVHRDLKPSNILVTAEGQAKLLDFGIAKRLASDAAGAEAGVVTCPWLTPAYASPEQFLGAPTTVATDVYSLGIVLFELLTGRLPHSTGAATTSISLQLETPAPSQVVTGHPDAVELAGGRGTTPSALRRRLGGDLDHILLRALRDSPDARYPSVQAFARDLERHRQNLPVRARRGSAFYRTRKFLKRRALSSFLAACLVVALVAFGAVARQQVERLAHERDATERQRLAAETMAANLAETIRLMRPISGQGFDPAIRRILDHSTASTRAEFAEQDEVRSRILAALGGVYRDLAFLEPAEPLLEERLAFVRATAASPLEVSEALRSLARLRLVQDRGADAEALVREALVQVRPTGEAEVEETVRLLSVLSSALRAQDRLADARIAAEQALELGQSREGVAVRRLAELNNTLALALKDAGEIEAAREAYEEALRLYREDPRSGDLDVAAVLNNLGSLAAVRGRFDEAEKHLRDSLETHCKLQSDEHPDVVSVRANLAAVLHMSGDYDAAEALYRQALEQSRRQGQPKALATDLSNLGLLLSETGKAEEAEPYLRESLQVRRAALPADHSSTATSLHNLGLVLLKLGRLEEAHRQLLEALAMRRRVLGDDHWMVGNSLNSLALLALEVGEPCLAAEQAREAEDILEAALSSDHWRAAVSRSLLGSALARLGAAKEAEILLVRSLDSIRESRGAESRQAQEARARLEEARIATQPAESCRGDAWRP